MNVQGLPPHKLFRPALVAGWAAALILSLSTAARGATVVAWGADDSGQIDLPAGLTNVVALAGGASHSLALKSNGTVAAWGFNSSGQANVPPGLANVTAIAAGATFSMALQSNGTIVVWGSQSAAPVSATNVTAIAAGWSHSLALRGDGTVVSWGDLTNQPPAWLSNVVAIAAGNGQSLALRLDGSVIAWGDNAFGKTNVSARASSNIVAIAAGADHCLALQRNGGVVAWGRTSSGQASVPASLTNAVAISGGALHSLALRTDGLLVAWGDNAYGQSTTSANDPGYIRISAGGYHNLALKGDGTPYIIVPPGSQTAIISKSATLQVLATGGQPLQYQWYHYGTNIVGATNVSLTINNVQAKDGGPYTVSVANSFNTAVSPPAILTALGVPPYVTLPPANTTVLCGDTASFQVAVDGSSPYTYQWSFNGAAISGATRTALIVPSVTLDSAGTYYVAVSNAFGGVITGGVLTVTAQPSTITSALSASGVQGQPFSYSITALHSPTMYSAAFLPGGLTINTNTGRITGIPDESGVFGVTIIAANACGSDSKVLLLTLTSGTPVITSATNAVGTEATPFTYQITASGSPTNFGAQGLPQGLSVDPVTGIISGTPVYAGNYTPTIWATNVWGAGSAQLSLAIGNMVINNLNIGNVTYVYGPPYLLDFQFSLYTVLGDPNDPSAPRTGVVVDPRLLSATCLEDGITNSDETGSFLVQGNKKVIKAMLVLDFTYSIANLVNGDANSNGISDAVDFELAGAQQFVNQLPSDVQVGVYEFHRDDWFPSNVVALTSDKVLLDNSIAGILTNYVHNFSSGSRCWDALNAAITNLGPANPDEQHFVVFISDGSDQSSLATLNSVIQKATNNAVKVYAVGFGDDLDPTTLQAIASQTQGAYYTATTPADIATKLGQITKDAQGQYILRWATLKRSSTSFMPSFQISYAGFTATSPTNPFTPPVTNIDNSTNPPIITITPGVTNYIIGAYNPVSNAGPVTVGTLRTVVNAQVLPSAIDLRTVYTPRNITQFRFKYVPNWPCTPVLQSTNPGEILAGWTMTRTNDSAGTNYLLLSSPNPALVATAVPFTAFSKLVTFQFNDVLSNPSNAFAVLSVDTNLPSYTGGQTFFLTNQYLTFYPKLPNGTPVPWLIANGYQQGNSNSWAQAELADPDGDGMVNWKEYRANTNPTNFNSKLVVNSVGRLPDGRFQVNFSSSINRTYRVDGSTDLINWQTVQDNIVGVGANITVIDTRYIPNVTTIFYRVAVY